MQYTSINEADARRSFVQSKIAGLEQQHLNLTLESEFRAASGDEPDAAQDEQRQKLEQQISWLRQQAPAEQVPPQEQ